MNTVRNGSVGRGSYVEVPKRSTETASAGSVNSKPTMAENSEKLEISGENKQQSVKSFLKEMISFISNGFKSEGTEKTEKPTKTEKQAPVPHQSTVGSHEGIKPNRTMASDAARTRNHDVDVFKDACKELKLKFPEKAEIIDAAIAKMDDRVASLPTEFDTSKSPGKATKEFMGFTLKSSLSNTVKMSFNKNIGDRIGVKFELSVDKKDIAGTKTEFKALCKELGIKGEAKGLLGAAARAKVDGGPVVTKSASFIGKSGEDGGMDVTSTITPANGNAQGEVRSARMAELGDGIVSSQSNKSTESRAGNLQMTSLTADGKTVFSASRHAILSTKNADPKTVKMPPDPDRGSETVSSFTASFQNKSAEDIESALKPFVGNSDDLKSMAKAFASGDESKIESQTTKLAGKISNRNKASDLVNASLTQKINRELSECKTPEEKAAKIADWQQNGIQLDLTSVSLVTPHGYYIGSETLGVKKEIQGYEEKSMLADQAEALGSIQNLSPEEAKDMLSGLSMDGKPLFDPETLPKVTVDTASTNFGVNPGERLGRSTQAKQNEAAMGKLFEKADKALAKMDPNSAEAKTLKALNDKTKEAFKQYQSEGSLSTNGRLNAYEMPVLTLALSSLSGGVPAFNCMSGKDRTGMADVLVKRMMTEITAAGGDEKAIGNAVNMFSNAEATFTKLESGKPVSDEELSSFRDFQQDNREMMLSSGNKEVQIDNTGTFGFKLKGGNNETNFEMLFGISREDTSEVTGYSSTKGA